MNSEATPNPLLDLSDLPLFDAIIPEHVEPAIALLLKEANVALETVTQEAFPADWVAMASTLDVDGVCDAVLRGVESVFGAASSWIMLHDFARCSAQLPSKQQWMPR